MFTGIIETRGRIEGMSDRGQARRLVVSAPDWQPRYGALRHGDSICVSGVCLTLVEHQHGRLSFDVIHETLQKSKLGSLGVADPVNLESSLTPQTPIGGHFVQGHVDGVGTIVRVQKGRDWRLTIQPPADLAEYIVPKGSIAIDGISLTVAAVPPGAFEVAIIPTTLDLTTLAFATEGEPVNLETDIVSKTIVHWLRRQAQSTRGGVTMDHLRDAGLA